MSQEQRAPEHSPRWEGPDWEDVHCGIDYAKDQVRLSSCMMPEQDDGDASPKPDVVELPLKTARELVVWLGERLGTSGKTVTELEARLQNVKAELRHSQMVRNNNANAMAQMLEIPYGLTFPRVLHYLEEQLPYLRATSIYPELAACLDQVLDEYDFENGDYTLKQIRGLREALARVQRTAKVPEKPFSEPAERLRGLVLGAGRRLQCEIGPLMPNGMPANDGCACEPCTFRRSLYKAFTDTFGQDTIFDFPGRYIQRNDEPPS